MLIVLSGKGRSGKDTAATMIEDILDYDCRLIAYGDYLKYIVSTCFDIGMDHLYGDDKEKVIDDLPIRTRSGHVTNHKWTARKLLQYLGTDVFRTIKPDCWVQVVKDTVMDGQYKHNVITDARFINEVDWVVEAGGIHIRIERQNKDFVSNPEHESEAGIPKNVSGANHFVINNDYDLRYLQSELEKIIDNWRNRSWQTKNMH